MASEKVLRLPTHLSGGPPAIRCMEGYLTRPHTRSHTISRIGEAGRADTTAKMAAAAADGMQESCQPAQVMEGCERALLEHSRIAESVAQHLHPTIEKAVEQALQKSTQEIKDDLLTQAQCIVGTERRISDLEDDLAQAQTQLSTAE